MKLFRLLAATPLLLAAGLAFADGGAADAVATPPTAAPVVDSTTVQATAAPAPAVIASADKDLKICRMVRTIGSNRATRICRTKAQLEADAEAARNSLTGPSERGN